MLILGSVLILLLPALLALSSSMIGSTQPLSTWHIESFGPVVFNPDGTLFATARGLIELRRADNGDLVGTLPTSTAGSIAWSPDGQFIAEGGGDGNVQVWRVTDASPFITLQTPDSAQADFMSVEDLTFSPDGQLLAAAIVGNRVRVWDVARGRLVHTLQKNLHGSDRRNSVAFHPEGEILAAITSSGDVVLWQAQDGLELRTLPVNNANDLIFSPDGKFLAVARSDDSYSEISGRDAHGEVQIWDLSSSEQEPVRRLLSREFLHHVIWSQNNQFVAAAGNTTENEGPLRRWEWWSSNRPIYLWNTTDDWSPQSFTSPQQEINGLTFSRDSQRLLASGAEIVSVWQVPKE